MADKTMLNFRCPSELLDAIDFLGQERHPSETAKHGCDRTKTLLDIVRAGIEALSNGSIVLQVPDKIVRHSKTENAIDIDARFAAIEQRLEKIEGLSDGNHESFTHELEQQLEVARADNQWLLDELANLQKRRDGDFSQLQSQLQQERADREKFQAELSAVNARLAAALEQNEKLAPSAIDVEARSQLEIVQAENQRLHTELGNSAVEREELNQELTEVRSQLETDRADRQEVEKRDRAAILAQRSQIKDLKRGYGLDPTHTENILRRQLADLQKELSELKQNLAPAPTPAEKLPDAAIILNQVRAKRKKLKIGLDDLKVILKILASSAKTIEEGT
jgi:chromosome segregation ATPase